MPTLDAMGGAGMNVGRQCRLPLLGALAAIGLTACGAMDPYVYKENEFARTSPTFNKTPEDLSEVRICYLSAVTSFETANRLAEERCAAYGKHARFISNIYGDCPLATPIGARFACVKP